MPGGVVQAESSSRIGALWRSRLSAVRVRLMMPVRSSATGTYSSHPSSAAQVLHHRLGQPADPEREAIGVAPADGGRQGHRRGFDVAAAVEPDLRHQIGRTLG
jgi:hypothetical protein